MTTVTLGVPDRMLLLGILREATGNRTTQRVIRELYDEIDFSKEDHETLGLKEANGRMFWDQDIPKDINASDPAFALVRECLRTIESTGQLKLEHEFLYVQFVEAPQEEE